MQKLPPCLTDPVLCGSKKDLLKLSSSEKMVYCLCDNILRKCKNCCVAWIGREDWEYLRATALQTQTSVRKEWEHMVKCWSIDSPAACRGDHAKADSLPATMSVGVGNPCWSLVAGPVAPWREEPMLWQFASRTWATHAEAGCVWRTVPCGKDPH